MDARTLALYLGCDCAIYTEFEKDDFVKSDMIGKLHKVSLGGLVTVSFGEQNEIGKTIREVKPILRPLSSMTEEHKKEIALMVDAGLKKFEVIIGVNDSLQVKTWGGGMSHIMDNYSPKILNFLRWNQYDCDNLILTQQAISTQPK